MDPNAVNFTVGIRGTSIHFPCKCGESFGRGEARNFCPECGAELGPLTSMGGLEVRSAILVKLVQERVRDILQQARDEYEAYAMLEREFYPPTAEGEE